MGISNSRQRGVSLLEVMVALVIFAIGMLGAAALMASAMRDNNSAYLRTQAVFLAHNMAERIRASVGATGANTDAYDDIPLDATGGTDATCDWDNPCDVATLAEKDEFEWKTMIGQMLPNGQGSVTAQGTSPETFVITVQWTEALAQNDLTGGTGNQTVVLAIHPWTN